MTPYRLLFTSQAKKDIEGLQQEIQLRVKAALEKISPSPFLGKSLKGPLKGFHSYRFGDYRVIYEIRKGILVVIILKAGHRKNVYKIN